MRSNCDRKEKVLIIATRESWMIFDPQRGALSINSWQSWILGGHNRSGAATSRSAQTKPPAESWLH